jgi:hypothetical protein
MGTWGTGISSNDTYADIYDEFFELYNEGLEIHEITRRLIAMNQETIGDSDDCNNFWFALAKAQWECKELDPNLHIRVKNIVESGSDITVWRRLEADEKDLRKRKLVLEKFLRNISKEKEKAKARNKKKEPKIYQPVFEKGDCITYKLQNGNYGGCVVLEAIYDTTSPYVNLIATTRINQPDKPVIADFEGSNVLVLNFAAWKDSPNIQWYYPIRHKNVAHLLEIVGKIKVTRIYQYWVNNSAEYGACLDFDPWFIGVTFTQFEFEKENKISEKRIAIKELTL